LILRYCECVTAFLLDASSIAHQKTN
jgi:hypothetical protein